MDFPRLQQLISSPWVLELLAWLLALRLVLHSAGLAVARRVRNGKPVLVRVLGKEVLYVASVDSDNPTPQESEKTAVRAVSGSRRTTNLTSHSNRAKRASSRRAA